MAAITYYDLTTYFINKLTGICGNISESGSGYTDVLLGDEVDPQDNLSLNYNLSDIASGSSTSKLYLYSFVDNSNYHYGAPSPISKSAVRTIIKNEFSQFGIDTDSTASRTPKEAVHFFNAALLFMAYHLYVGNSVTGDKLPYRYFNNGNNRAILFNSERQTKLTGIGAPIIKSGYASKIEERDLMIETFNSLSSLIASSATRLGGLDLAGSTVTSCSSSSSCSSSCSSCSNSCSSSSVFIAYFNI